MHRNPNRGRPANPFARRGGGGGRNMTYSDVRYRNSPLQHRHHAGLRLCSPGVMAGLVGIVFYLAYSFSVQQPVLSDTSKSLLDMHQHQHDPTSPTTKGGGSAVLPEVSSTTNNPNQHKTVPERLAPPEHEDYEEEEEEFLPEDIHNQLIPIATLAPELEEEESSVGIHGADADATTAPTEASIVVTTSTEAPSATPTETSPAPTQTHSEAPSKAPTHGPTINTKDEIMDTAATDNTTAATAIEENDQNDNNTETVSLQPLDEHNEMALPQTNDTADVIDSSSPKETHVPTTNDEDNDSFATRTNGTAPTGVISPDQNQSLATTASNNDTFANDTTTQAPEIRQQSEVPDLDNTNSNNETQNGDDQQDTTNTSSTGSVLSESSTNSTAETNHDLSVNLTREETLQHPLEGDLSIETQQSSNNSNTKEVLDTTVSSQNIPSNERDSNNTSSVNEGIVDRVETNASTTSTTNTTTTDVGDELIVATQTTVVEQEETSSNNETMATGNTNSTNEDTDGAPGDAALEVQDPTDNRTLAEATTRNTTDPAVMATAEPSAVNVTLSDIEKS